MARVDAPHIYITYHRDAENDSFANRLARDLTQAGAITSLIDDSPNAPAATRAMLTDPGQNRWLIVLASPPSVTSPWILNAVNSAREAMMARRMRGALVVLVTPTPERNIPAVWRSFPLLDATTRPYDETRLDLLTRIGLNDTPRADTAGEPPAISNAAPDRNEARGYGQPPSAVVGGVPDTTGAIAQPQRPLDPGAPAREADDTSPDLTPPFEPPPAPGAAPVGQPPPGYQRQEPAQAVPSTLQGPAAPARSVQPAPIALERVAFAAYYPKEAQPAKPLPLLVYLALDEALAMARVAALAAERLAGRLDQFRSDVADDRMTLRRGTKLRLVPVIPGFHVNPQWMDVTWDEDAQQHEFSLRVDSAPEGRAAEGAVRVYQGFNLRAQIPLSIFVAHGAGNSQTPADFASAIARAYRQVFASYSHRDTPVVESCEAAARSVGDRYLRDVMTLQSGQQWNSQLMKMIAEADIFQLFWSRSAAASPFVRQEWEYALTLQANRPGFIRPVYWSQTPFAIPGELNPLHFEPLDLSALGWSPLRRFLYSLQTG